MPRIARVVGTGYPHHITQRGNYKRVVFTKSSDYERYLYWLNLYAAKNMLSILAYCLMPNHVHFIAIPKMNYSLAKTFNACHMRYAQHFNKKHGLLGHLWQGRFYSCILSESHLYAVMRYAENNPVRAGFVKRAWDWKWSSARYHVTKEAHPVSLIEADSIIKIPDWKDYLSGGEDTNYLKEIRANTLSGRPLGDDAFISKIENMLHLRIRTTRRGRPKKYPNN